MAWYWNDVIDFSQPPISQSSTQITFQNVYPDGTIVNGQDLSGQPDGTWTVLNGTFTDSDGDGVYESGAITSVERVDANSGSTITTVQGTASSPLPDYSVIYNYVGSIKSLSNAINYYPGANTGEELGNIISWSDTQIEAEVLDASTGNVVGSTVLTSPGGAVGFGNTPPATEDELLAIFSTAQVSKAEHYDANGNLIPSDTTTFSQLPTALDFVVAGDYKNGDSSTLNELLMDGQILGGDNVINITAPANEFMAMEGSDGNDTIVGGDSSDYIAGGAGNDTLTGGAGNDYFSYVGDVDLSGNPLAPNIGDDTITDFTPGQDKIQFEEIYRSDGSQMTAADLNITQDANGDTIITAKNGEFTGSIRVQNTNVNSSDIVFSYFAPCFPAGTLIQTLEGEKPIERIVPGDKVMTIDGAARKVEFIGVHKVIPDPELGHQERNLPILIKADAFGPGVPRRDLVTSWWHGIMLQGAWIQTWFGEPRVIIAAGRLVNGDTVQLIETRDPLTYYNIVLDRHDIVFAEGAAVETFRPLRGNYRSFENWQSYKPFTLPPQQVEAMYPPCCLIVDDDDEGRFIASNLKAVAGEQPMVAIAKQGKVVRTGDA